MQLEDKLIEHLSKEIETQTDNLMTFRTRVSFAALIGPFFLLGSLLVAAKRIPKARNGWPIAGGLLLMILSYLTLGGGKFDRTSRALAAACRELQSETNECRWVRSRNVGINPVFNRTFWPPFDPCSPKLALLLG
jgi:hypothetical protein